MSYKKLRKNGVLLFSVPDMSVTFDRDRKITSIEHLVKDYENASGIRVYMNIFDFILNTKVVTCKQLIDILVFAHFDIHFHTFTVESFYEIIEAMEKYIVWVNKEFYPRLKFAGANEFYVKLTK